ncbi:MAG: hypothetical protein WB607_05435, partial [Candidatus Acidiferrum sp.]
MLFAVGTLAQQERAGIRHNDKPTFTTFEAPGAGKSNSQGTITFNINTAGDITGTYIDASNVYHGFVRAANGTITTFEVRGAGTGAHQGTIAISINTAGDITRTYVDASYVYHRFVRAASGKIKTFNAPGAGTSQ